MKRPVLPTPPPLRVLLLLAVIAAVLAGALVPWDRALIRRLNPTTSRFDGVLRFVDGSLPVLLLGLGLAVGGALLVFGKDARARRAGLLLAVAPLLANRVTGVLKELVDRPRPQHADARLEPLRVLVELADHYSFPSGHVTSATAVACALLFVIPGRRLRFAVLGLIPLMVWNRVALVVHFPSDAVAGVAIGALGVAGFAALLRNRDPHLPAPLRLPILVASWLVLTAVGRTPVFALDPVTLSPLDGFELVPTRLRTVFEPFVGPALELAWLPGPTLGMRALLPFLAAVLAMFLGCSRRLGWRAQVGIAGAASFYCAVVAALAWNGRLPADRFQNLSVPGVFVDLHVHAGDPVDGALGRDLMLLRARDRGIGVVAVTNHDAVSPAPEAIPGCEWSGFRHPAQPYLHLLVFGPRGAIDTALEHAVPPLESGGNSGSEAALAMVRAVKAASGTVVVAHWWRTARSMEALGLGGHLPSPKALADAGVDGFEVANRHWDADAEDRRQVAAIDALCRERGLLRIASSDDHGRPAGSPCVSFVAGDFPAEAGQRRDAVLSRLAAREGVEPVIFQRERNGRLPAAGLAGPVAMWRYFASLGIAGRASWLLWMLGAIAAVRGFRRLLRKQRAPSAPGAE